MFFRSLSHKAFTLIELLIVIVIIGILATALIPRFTGAQNKARYARVEKDFRDFNTAAFMAQTNTNKTLGQLYSGGFGGYGDYCGTWSLSGDAAITNLSDTHACVRAWKNLLRTVELYAGMNSGSLASMERDPWGNPYVFDLNDGELGWGSCGTYDTIHTVGPDGFAQGINFANAPLDAGDNKGTNIMQAFCRNAY